MATLADCVPSVVAWLAPLEVAAAESTIVGTVLARTEDAEWVAVAHAMFIPAWERRCLDSRDLGRSDVEGL
jgi:hypothetical protein